MSKAVWWLQVAAVGPRHRRPEEAVLRPGRRLPAVRRPARARPTCGFGDLSYRPPSRQRGRVHGVPSAHARRSSPTGSHAGYWRWWTEQLEDARARTASSGSSTHANLPPLPPAKPPTDLPPSKVFHGIGVASLHTTLLDSRDDVHLLFKSSPFGTQSHGHNPHNTFQLNAYGEALLTTCVYRDLHGSKFHYQWAHSTRGAQRRAGRRRGADQAHAQRPHGRIVAEQLTPEWDYVAGDATERLRRPPDALPAARRLREAIRVAARALPPLIVLYDDLEAQRAGHVPVHAARADGVRRGRQPGARLPSSSPRRASTCSTSRPCRWPSGSGTASSRRRARSSPTSGTSKPARGSQRSELGMLTVLVPHRAGQRPAWTAERIETGGRLGVRFVCGGREQTAWFPPPGRSGRAAVDGIR